jgi:hypothetical protein
MANILQHIHETIQPVVHKETVQPSVVHTTVPIHEVHHNASQHHQTSELPAMSLAEFKQQGGVLGGREERYDGFEGEPKHIGGTLKHMMDGKTSKRDSGHAAGLKEGSMHGDFAPLDGGHKNNQNASGLVGGAGTASGLAGTRDTHHNDGLGHRDTHHNSGLGHKGTAGGVAAAGTAAGAGGLAHHEHSRRRGSASSASSSDNETKRAQKSGGVGQKIKSMLSN